MTKKAIVMHDTMYIVDTFYLEGVEAFQQSVPWSCNPYRDGSRRYEQWESGHVNESEVPGHLEEHK